MTITLVIKKNAMRQWLLLLDRGIEKKQTSGKKTKFFNYRKKIHSVLINYDQMLKGGNKEGSGCAAVS